MLSSIGSYSFQDFILYFIFAGHLTMHQGLAQKSLTQFSWPISRSSDSSAALCQSESSLRALHSFRCVFTCKLFEGPQSPPKSCLSASGPGSHGCLTHGLCFYCFLMRGGVRGDSQLQPDPALKGKGPDAQCLALSALLKPCNENTFI
jgi:hypothetical protein